MRTRHAARDAKIGRLRALAPMSRCSRGQLSLAAQLGTFATVPPGRVLCREGESGSQAFVVAEGEVEVTSRGQVIARLGPGAVCGELAVLAGGRRVATATAATTVTVFTMSSSEFWGLLAQAPLVADEVMAQAAARGFGGTAAGIGTQP